MFLEVKDTVVQLKEKIVFKYGCPKNVPFRDKILSFEKITHIKKIELFFNSPVVAPFFFVPPHQSL